MSKEDVEKLRSSRGTVGRGESGVDGLSGGNKKVGVEGLLSKGGSGARGNGERIICVRDRSCVTIRSNDPAFDICEQTELSECRVTGALVTGMSDWLT